MGVGPLAATGGHFTYLCANHCRATVHIVLLKSVCGQHLVRATALVPTYYNYFSQGCATSATLSLSLYYILLIYHIAGIFAGANVCEYAIKGSRRNFYGSYFCDKAMLSTVPTGLLNFQRFLFLRKFDHPQKPQKFAPCKNFPLYGSYIMSGDPYRLVRCWYPVNTSVAGLLVGL